MPDAGLAHHWTFDRVLQGDRYCSGARLNGSRLALTPSASYVSKLLDPFGYDGWSLELWTELGWSEGLLATVIHSGYKGKLSGHEAVAVSSRRGDQVCPRPRAWWVTHER